ncbi:MAG: hypothetical protein MK193_15540 [Lentisphaeria bacterium]|nr:hypothetical protein [Lentisphaeria bacterium]
MMKEKILAALILCISVAVACNVQSTETNSCLAGVKDERFSNYIFEGPLTADKATKRFKQQTIGGSLGLADEKWLSFLNGLSKGGCIYEFTSSEADWNSLRGVKGYALVRKAKIIDIIIIKKS